MWKATLNREFDFAYRAMDMLAELVSDDELDFKPEGDNNWLTLGQLLRHCTQACGWCCHGFVDGVWDMSALGYPDGPNEEGLLPADKMPQLESMEQFKTLIAEDQAIARAMVEKASDDDLENKSMTAPWGSEGTLGQLLLDSANHLAAHKTQLFYYLKMMGKPVNTMHLWGMQG